MNQSGTGKRTGMAANTLLHSGRCQCLHIVSRFGYMVACFIPNRKNLGPRKKTAMKAFDLLIFGHSITRQTLPQIGKSLQR